MIQQNFQSINCKNLKILFNLIQAKKIFVTGPPGSKLLELSHTLAEFMNFDCVSIGDLIEKELSKKLELQTQKPLQLINIRIFGQISIFQRRNCDQQNEKRSYIFEGFPKTRVQSLALQQEGIIPDVFLIVEMSEDKIYQCCLKILDAEDIVLRTLTQRRTDPISGKIYNPQMKQTKKLDQDQLQLLMKKKILSNSDQKDGMIQNSQLMEHQNTHLSFSKFQEMHKQILLLNLYVIIQRNQIKIFLQNYLSRLQYVILKQASLINFYYSQFGIY